MLFSCIVIIKVPVLVATLLLTQRPNTLGKQAVDLYDALEFENVTFAPLCIRINFVGQLG